MSENFALNFCALNTFPQQFIVLVARRKCLALPKDNAERRTPATLFSSSPARTKFFEIQQIHGEPSPHTHAHEVFGRKLALHAKREKKTMKEQRENYPRGGGAASAFGKSVKPPYYFDIDYKWREIPLCQQRQRQQQLNFCGAVTRL